MFIFILTIQSIYVFSPENNSNSITEDIYKVKVTRISCTSLILDIIKEQSEKHNMDWKIIYAIVGYESEFNSNKIYTTKQEKSYGLLQINIRTNFPKDKDPDLLLNPEYNLDYQLSNIKEIYDKGVKLGLNNTELAEYVSRKGQRADWNNKENVKYIRYSINKYFQEIS